MAVRVGPWLFDALRQVLLGPLPGNHHNYLVANYPRIVSGLQPWL